MIDLLIGILCVTYLDAINCETRLHNCVERLNQIKYQDSQWTDVPNEKMSLESLQECEDDIWVYEWED